MHAFRGETQLGYVLAIMIGAGMILGGCAATINYSYDPGADFSTIKSYSWATEPFVSSQDPLVEKNVRYYADQSLKSKGFTLTSENPDVVISMNYERGYSYPYELRVLNLYVYRRQGKEPIWEGTATGTIRSDAASSDLSESVKKILATFPPKP